MVSLLTGRRIFCRCKIGAKRVARTLNKAQVLMIIITCQQVIRLDSAVQMHMIFPAYRHYVPITCVYFLIRSHNVIVGYSPVLALHNGQKAATIDPHFPLRIMSLDEHHDSPPISSSRRTSDSGTGTAALLPTEKVQDNVEAHRQPKGERTSSDDSSVVLVDWEGDCDPLNPKKSATF